MSEVRLDEDSRLGNYDFNSGTNVLSVGTRSSSSTPSDFEIRVRKLERDVASLQESVEELESLEGNVTAQITQLTTRVDGIADDFYNLQMTFDSFRDDVNSELSTFGNTINRLDSDIRSIESTLESVTTSLAQSVGMLRLDLDSLANLTNELATQVSGLASNVEGVVGSISDITDIVNEMQEAVDSIVNENILINPNFKLNTRGYGTYGGNKTYCADMWYIYTTSSCTVNVSDINGIRRYNGDGGIAQVIPYDTVNKGYGKYTLSFKIANSEKSVTFSFRDENDVVRFDDIIFDDDDVQVHCYYATDNSTNWFGVRLILKTKLYLEWVKLERGVRATKFLEPNPVEEQIKCYYYYQPIMRLPQRPFEVSENTLKFKFTKQYPMYKTPAIINPSVTIKTLDGTVQEGFHIAYRIAQKNDTSVQFDATKENHGLSDAVGDIGNVFLDGSVYPSV